MKNSGIIELSRWYPCVKKSQKPIVGGPGNLGRVRYNNFFLIGKIVIIRKERKAKKKKRVEIT